MCNLHLAAKQSRLSSVSDNRDAILPLQVIPFPFSAVSVSHSSGKPRALPNIRLRSPNDDTPPLRGNDRFRASDVPPSSKRDARSSRRD